MDGVWQCVLLLCVCWCVYVYMRLVCVCVCVVHVCLFLCLWWRERERDQERERRGWLKWAFIFTKTCSLYFTEAVGEGPSVLNTSSSPVTKRRSSFRYLSCPHSSLPWQILIPCFLYTTVLPFKNSVLASSPQQSTIESPNASLCCTTVLPLKKKVWHIYLVHKSNVLPLK